MSKFFYTTLLLSPMLVAIVATYAGASPNDPGYSWGGGASGVDGLNEDSRLAKEATGKALPVVGGGSPVVVTDEMRKKWQSLIDERKTLSELSVNAQERQALEERIKKGDASAADKARYYQLTDDLMNYRKSIYSDDDYQKIAENTGYVSSEDRIAALEAACAGGDNAAGCDKDLLDALQNPAPLSAAQKAAYETALKTKNDELRGKFGVTTCQGAGDLYSSATKAVKDGDLPENDLAKLCDAAETVYKDQLAQGLGTEAASKIAAEYGKSELTRLIKEEKEYIENERKRLAAEAEEARRRYNELVGAELAGALSDISGSGNCGDGTSGRDCYEVVDYVDGKETSPIDVTGRKKLGSDSNNIAEDYRPSW